jgi:hypothetical protein
MEHNYDCGTHARVCVIVGRSVYFDSGALSIAVSIHRHSEQPNTLIGHVLHACSLNSVLGIG